MNPIIWLVLLVVGALLVLLYLFTTRKKWGANAIQYNKDNEQPYYLPRYAETDTRGFRLFYYALSFAIALLTLSLLLLFSDIVSSFEWKWNIEEDKYEDIETVEVHLLPPPTLPDPPQPPPSAPTQKPAPPEPAPPKPSISAPKPNKAQILSALPNYSTNDAAATNKPTNSTDTTAANTSDKTSNNTSQTSTPEQGIEKDTTAWKSTYLTKFPSFPGGETKMRQFIQENITYPPLLRESGWEGVVRISAEVLETGSWGQIFVSNKDVPATAAKEAKRILTIMPPWIPAERDDKVVKCLITIPIRFEMRTKKP